MSGNVSGIWDYEVKRTERANNSAMELEELRDGLDAVPLSQKWKAFDLVAELLFSARRLNADEDDFPVAVVDAVSALMNWRDSEWANMEADLEFARDRAEFNAERAKAFAFNHDAFVDANANNVILRRKLDMADVKITSQARALENILSQCRKLEDEVEGLKRQLQSVTEKKDASKKGKSKGE